MIWLGAEIDGPLVLIRAIHFAASAATAGVLLFRTFVAEPALRPSPELSAIVQSRLVQFSWAGLAIAAATGLVWLLLQTMSITGLASGEAIRTGAVLVVVTETQFGLVSEIRAGLAVLLSACLVLDRFDLSRWLALLVASGLVGAIAWTGHAGSTLGELGNLHLAADVVHLFAASAWIGGLIGLSVLFAVGRRSALERGPLQLNALRRFSVLGMISVAALIVSGSVNAWILVGSFHALLVTDYGLLLLFKIVAFAIMVAFAAMNRFWLMPRLALAEKNNADPAALAALTRNSLIELALGLSIYAIVGMLGTLHPAIHLMN